MARRIHRLDKVLQRALGKMDLTAKLEGYRIWPLWNEIVGDEIAKRAQPERLSNRILFVKVSNSVWMQELQTMKPMLLEKIHRKVKKARIDNIRFKLGEIFLTSPPSMTSLSAEHTDVIRLSPEMEAHLEQIQDGELKQLMRHAMVKQAGRTAKRGSG
jgi:hypothetical protein